MKSMVVTLGILFFIFLVMLFSLNKLNTNKVEGSSKTITVSNYAIESMVKEIVGDKINVVEAYDFTTEMHEKISLTANEMKTILDSDIFICISAKYEPYVGTIIQARENVESEVEILCLEDYYEGGIVDEHIFLSPKQAIYLNEIIYNKILKFDNKNTQYYEKNYNRVLESLRAIDLEYSNFGETNKKTIYAEHDAYYYLRKDYNIDIWGINGVSHESEVSASKIKRTVQDIENNNIKAVYSENAEELDPVLETIVKETDVNVYVLNNLEVNNGSEYTDVYKNNLELMKRV